MWKERLRHRISDTKAATCEEAGATTYTATVRFNNKDYTTGEKTGGR